MSKRAERRHHEERVKSRFKRVVKEQTKWMMGIPGNWEWKWENGRVVSRRFVLDRSLAAKRLQQIDRLGGKMAHHPRHDCEMCRMGIKEEKHRHEFEVAKKRPFEETDDEEE